MTEETTIEQTEEEATETNGAPAPESAEDMKFQEVVEIPWEEVQETLQLRVSLTQAEEQVSTFLLNAEKRKTMLMSRLAELESSLYQAANALRETKALNPDWAYELKLPDEQGEKGYFVRKEDQQRLLINVTLASNHSPGLLKNLEILSREKEQN